MKPFHAWLTAADRWPVCQSGDNARAPAVTLTSPSFLRRRCKNGARRVFAVRKMSQLKRAAESFTNQRPWRIHCSKRCLTDKPTTGRVISKPFRVSLCRASKIVSPHSFLLVPTPNQLQRKPPHQLPAAATCCLLSHTDSVMGIKGTWVWVDHLCISLSRRICLDRFFLFA